MLSIVKIDLDSSSDNMDPIDGVFMEEEDDGEYFIRPELSAEGITTALDSIEVVPVVYTTRLDDMVVLNSFLPNQHPRELTAKILKESKPKLYMNPKNNSGRINKPDFGSLEEKLKRLYYNSQKLNIKEEPDMQPPALEVIPNLINTEVSHESNATKKYNELLKLCKPLSIVLTKLDITLKPKSRVIHDKAKRQTVSTGTYEIEEMEHFKEVGPSPTSPAQISHLNVSGYRLLTNGIMEIHDLYSDEYTVYCTDYKGHLLDWFVDSPDNEFKYQSIRDSAEIALYFKFCCWVNRNEHMQSLYPKVLLYTNLRFMKKPHLCPIDECICCCRSRDEFARPNIAITSNKVSKVKPSEYLREDLEIQELEDEIQDIIQMNKTPRLNTNEWLRALLTKASTDPPEQSQTSLIEKALSYKPKPKKQTENRRLLTLKQEKSQPDVIVFRNFALDERDVYEINANGELQFYTKLTCFNNASRPDVKKLLQKPKSVNDVCCWFKRESIISELINSKSLHSSTLKFMRVRHACLSDRCNCCCKPKVIKETTLSDVPFSPQYTFMPLNTYKKGTKPLNVYNTDAAKSKSISQSSTITKEINKRPAILRKTLTSQPKNNKFTKPLPGSSVAAENITLKNADDDCEIVAVRPAIQVRPVVLNPLPVEQVKVATVVNVPNISNRDLSEEVNTTVASILERFKDVRLTINSNGKVAAALNMPINTLSTVELKVLASILSYAQSQVNLLGFKSEMSLSTFISRSATDNVADSENTVDQNEISQELTPITCNNTINLSSTNFVVNSNIAQMPNSTDTGITCKTEMDSNVLDESDTGSQLELTKLATDFDEIIQPIKTKENVFNLLTNAASARNPNFNDSFASFVATQYHAYSPKDQFRPVITSVFSMKDQETAASLGKDQEVMLSSVNQLSGAKTFGKPAKKFENMSKKRKQENAKTQGSKRIRVLSPSQLGADSSELSEPNEIYNTFCNPVQKSQSMEVRGFTPGVPLLANTNFQLLSLGDSKAQQSEIKTQPIPAPNFNPSSSNFSGSSKTLVVAPLNIGNMNAGTVNVPVSVSSLTSNPTSTEESHALSIKEDDDDYCILGM